MFLTVCLYVKQDFVIKAVALLLLHLSFVLKGVHAVRGRRSADCWHSWKTSPGLGSEKHGLRSAKKRVESQVSDSLHQSVSQQTGALAFGIDRLRQQCKLDRQLTSNRASCYG